VLAEVEQHVNHADPHLARRGQRAGVIAVADDLPFAPERAVDRERQPDGQPVHAAAGAAGLVALDDEVAVVLLDREVDHPKPVDRRARDGRAERPEHARRAERRQPRVARMVTWTGIEDRPSARGVRHRRTAARLAPGALASAPHVRALPRGNRSCRRPADLIARMFGCRRRRRGLRGISAGARDDRCDGDARGCRRDESGGGRRAAVDLIPRMLVGGALA
jgi:hypothetical protein